MSDELYEEALAHFGVKGMKWGVRNTKPDNDIVLKKGTQLHNISDAKPRELNAPVFTSHIPTDVLNYRANLGGTRALFGEKVFENVFEAKKSIRAPSQVKAINEFKKLYESNPETVLRGLAASKKHMDVSAAIMNKVFKQDRDEVYYKRLSKKGEGWVETKGYHNFIRSFGTEGSITAKEKYFTQLSKDGYNSILDVNDAKHYGSEQPLLIFKGSNTLRTKSVTELSEDDLRRAQDAYTAYILDEARRR